MGGERGKTIEQGLRKSRTPGSRCQDYKLWGFISRKAGLNYPCSFRFGSSFTLKEGSHHNLKICFSVHDNIVSGLTYINTVWKSGVRVDNTRVILGTLSPQQEPYTYVMGDTHM